MESSVLEQLIELLEASRRDVSDSVASLSDADAARKPAPGRWSALDCMEHIVIAEGVYLSWLENGAVLDAPKRDPEREAWITARVANRDWNWQAPDVAVPTGRFRTVAKALAEFNAVRDRTVAAARARESQLFSVQAKHSVLGLMNGAELMRLAAGHASRHAAQIQEVRSSLS
jgi:uncharacterized damage-inducible protein DinB